MLRLRRLFVCLSQTLNVALAGGRPNEMLSAKLHRLRKLSDSRWKRRSSCVLCAAFNWLFWERDHCLGAYQSHVRRTVETYDQTRADAATFTKRTNRTLGSGLAPQ